MFVSRTILFKALKVGFHYPSSLVMETDLKCRHLRNNNTIIVTVVDVVRGKATKPGFL